MIDSRGSQRAPTIVSANEEGISLDQSDSGKDWVVGGGGAAHRRFITFTHRMNEGKKSPAFRTILSLKAWETKLYVYCV